MVYGKCQEAITHFKPTSPDGGVGGKLGIGELMLAGAGAGAVTSFVLYVSFPSFPPLDLPPHLPSYPQTKPRRFHHLGFILQSLPLGGITFHGADIQNTNRIDQM